jgi:hypothetical protein
MTGCLITPFKELRRPRQDRPRPFVPNSSDYGHGRTEHSQYTLNRLSVCRVWARTKLFGAHTTPPAVCQM